MQGLPIAIRRLRANERYFQLFRMLGRTTDFISLCRPPHIVKNGVVLLPFIASGFAVGGGASLIAFVAFCLMAMAVYAMNDALDAFYDMMHPEKCHRPVASGRISEIEAFTFAGVLSGTAVFVAGFWLGYEPAFLMILYFILNIFYSQMGKELAIIDMIIVSSGFVLRYLVGLSVTGLEAEFGWLVVPIFLAAMCLAAGKRLAKLSKSTQGSQSRIPSYYTKARVTAITVTISHFAVVITALLISSRWEQLVQTLNFSAVGLYVVGFGVLFIWTRVILALLLQKSEPVDIFTRDKITMISALAVVAFVGLRLEI